MYQTPNYDYPSFTNRRRPNIPSYGQGPLATRPQPTYPSFGAQQQTPQNPPNYFNDPTLAAGAGGSGTPAWSPPPGARPVPNNLWGGIPNDLARKGWRRMNGPDGKAYWVPPGTQFGATPSYTTYGPGSIGGSAPGMAGGSSAVGPSPSYVTY